jgi:RNA polymerase sigma factor (sigma-70 family)
MKRNMNGMMKKNRLVVTYDKLIEGCISGDRISQTRLYEKLLPLMRIIAYKYSHDMDTAIDSINMAFLKIMNNLTRYNHVDIFENWCSVIIKNSVIDSYRNRKRCNKLVQSVDSIDMEFGHKFTESNTAISTLIIEDINKVVNKLPDMTRTIVRMNLFEGYSHLEIGIKLGVSEEVSRWHLHKARKFLKNNLEV